MFSADNQDDGTGPNTSGTFSFGTRLGLVFIVETASLSAFLVASLLGYVSVDHYPSWQAIAQVARRGSIGWPSHIHIYFISLLCSDLLLSISGVMNVRWVHEAGVIEGSYCTAQAMLKQMGSVGVGLAILAIAISTWGLIVRKWKRPSSPRVALIVVSLIWIFVILMTTISLAIHKSKGNRFYGNTKYWCWIRSPYSLREGIALEYGWLWLTAVINCILYIPVAITLLESRRRNRSLETLAPEGERSMQTMAFQMSLYPVIYMLTITPSSVARFIQFARPNNPPPFPVSAFASVAFASSGIFNVLLFSITRPALIPRRSRQDGQSTPNNRTITSPRNSIQWRRRTEECADQWFLPLNDLSDGAKNGPRLSTIRISEEPPFQEPKSSGSSMILHP
ncbi:hypothetical protein SISSUDRAFT_1133172 [Sistotremastrum suecicum HHB10207 ss-3]|uniref:G-protein coupled receptors family 1 profile domain-containing protein n=1 Tax=Sistotremastrum suecicum HHB10207 ss-3 TaxID=1314776 RepID=A0A165XPQ2_9AGAM|nr:hypothetical protein SISSUDRAFT_1133172 [Sistotremastrum suecicum HHB10207 ss-3]